jgi:hypothetical protein
VKVNLLWPDRGAELGGQLSATDPTPSSGSTRATRLLEDLGATRVVAAMASGDALVAGVARSLLLEHCTDLTAIAYRQDAMRDALAHPELVRSLYALATEAVEREKRVYGGFAARPSSVLQHAVDVLELMVDVLRRLRALAEDFGDDLRSEAFRSLLDRCREQLDEPYVATVEDQLRRLRFPDGVTVGVTLGVGGRGINHVLHEPAPRARVLRRLLGVPRSGLGVPIDEDDDVALRALGELREELLEPVAEILAVASRNLLGFLAELRREVAFYVGGCNLAEWLDQLGEPSCFPTPLPPGRPQLVATGLVDVGLSLRTGERCVPNDVTAEGPSLVLVTGANQGGKSTFLRSVGIAQLMMQAGLQVAARSFCSNVAGEVYTHFERGEDAGMVSGRLDAELAELHAVADRRQPGDLLLLNESFSSTNEREGSLLAFDVVRALTEGGVRVVYVTHLFELADTLHRERADETCFLRAERREDGTRSFRLQVGVPLATSYGQDLYAEVFGPDGSGVAAPRR